MSSTSSQASAVSASDLKEPGCEPSRSAKSTSDVETCSARIGEVEESPSIRTSQPSIGDILLGPASASMSLPAASPAKTLVPRPTPLRESMARDPASGESLPVSLAKFDPALQSWKTSPISPFEDSTEFSGTWPRSGTMRNGTAYRLPPLVRLTRGIGFGLWPTPRKCSGRHSAGINRAEFYRAMGFSPSSKTKGGANRSPPGGPLSPMWIEWFMGFPIGWTDLESFQTRLSRKSRKSSGKRS